MRHFRNYLQHTFNPLHVYCRLCDWGLSSDTARKLSGLWAHAYRVCGRGVKFFSR